MRAWGASSLPAWCNFAPPASSRDLAGSLWPSELFGFSLDHCAAASRLSCSWGSDPQSHQCPRATDLLEAIGCADSNEVFLGDEREIPVST